MKGRWTGWPPDLVNDSNSGCSVVSTRSPHGVHLTNSNPRPRARAGGRPARASPIVDDAAAAGTIQ